MGFLFFPEALTATAGNGVKAGIYVPIGDLPGIETGELASSVADNIKESKILESVCNALYNAITVNEDGLLGFTAELANTGNGINLIETTFSFTVQYLANIADNEVTQITLPTKGTNVKTDKQSIKQIFPNATVVADDAAITGEGIVIETSTFSDFEDVAVTAATDADDRGYIAALIRSLPDFTMARDAIQASAITTATKLDGFSTTLDPDATDDTNPTTGVMTDDLPFIIPITLSTTLSVESLLNRSTQKFDVNVTTA